MTKANLTAQRLRELIDYDPSTGLFLWRVSRGGSAIAGTVAGHINKHGYRVIGVASLPQLSAGRLAWLHTTGDWPKGVIDHIDGNPLNNRIQNLRDVSQSQNCQNQRKARSDSKTGLLGASPYFKGGFKSQIRLNGKNLHIGYFDTPEEAHAAYLEAKRRMHRTCTI